MNEQKAKKWFISSLGILFFFFLTIATITIIVDPYFHYHKPLPFLSYRLYEERYTNDGIARHFEYDALITGTSMAQNFKPSEMDALFGTTTIKNTFSGAGYKELAEHLDRALTRNEDLKTVVWALDYNGLMRDADWQQYDTYPTYLYDNNPFNDVSYLFNKSIFYHGVLPCITMTLSGDASTTMDEYSSWVNETGLEHILYSYDRYDLGENIETEFTPEKQEAVTTTITQNVIELVNKYPNTTFYLFYPPYSICYWDAQYMKGTILQEIAAEKLATELLLECPNVRLYNFFDRHEVICNLDYYNDPVHYSAEVNSMILAWISQDIGLVTHDNYLDKLEAEKAFFTSYDYDGIYAGIEE